MAEASWHFIILPSYFFLSDCRVPPGECGFTSSDGDPGTNGVLQKLAAKRGIKMILAFLQAILYLGVYWKREAMALLPVCSVSSTTAQLNLSVLKFGGP